uniref:Major facilitator superfamily (MFS) profile domain-containing protein n=2 Tax=Bionectria ochroleuca TaxID=29856 RepID=A0A8H7NDY3_BIOOC
MAVGGHPVRWNRYHAHSSTLNRNDPIAPGIANPGMVNGPYAMPACSLIASALPWIASDFGEVSQLNWIVSCFNLTSAAFIPFWAQMADILGRNVTLNASIILMLIGSALCTGAPTHAFPVLLLGRAFQGLAAAGLNVVVHTILADRVSLQENARNWTLFSFIGGISYALGPVIGGYLTNANWRWCFAINLPVAFAAIIITFVVLRKELLGPQPIPELDETVETGRRTKLAARLKTVDVGGQVLFLVGFGLIILALTWGGATYPWYSAAIIVSLVFGFIFIGVFVCWERLMVPGSFLAEKLPRQRPMIPWDILSHRDIGLLFYSEITSGMAMHAVLYYCNIYFIAVKDYTADKAGVQLLYFTPGIAVGILLCSMICSSWPRMTWPAIFLGTLVEAVGIGMMAYALYTESSPTIFGMMALVGAGGGLRMMASPLHGVGTIGLTIMSTVFNNVSNLETDGDFSAIRNMDPIAQQAAKHSAKMGVVWAFVALAPLMVLAFLCSLLLGNVTVAGKSNPGADEDQHIVMEGIFLSHSSVDGSTETTTRGQ